MVPLRGHSPLWTLRGEGPDPAGQGHPTADVEHPPTGSWSPAMLERGQGTPQGGGISPEDSVGRHRARDSRGGPPSHGTHAASPRGRGAGLPPPRRGIPGDLGKGWWFLRDPEPSHQGLTACPQSPNACGALPSLGSGGNKQQQVFTLASWKKPGPSSESPARAASCPCHGRGTRTCSRCHAWPLPCSPVSVGPMVQLPTAGEAGVLLCWGGASTPARRDQPPRRVSQHLAPSQPRDGLWDRCASGVRSGAQPCSHPHTRGWRRGVTMGDCGTRPRAQPGHGGTERGQPQDQPLGLTWAWGWRVGGSATLLWGEGRGARTTPQGGGTAVESLQRRWVGVQPGIPCQQGARSDEDNLRPQKRVPRGVWSRGCLVPAGGLVLRLSSPRGHCPVPQYPLCSLA